MHKKTRLLLFLFCSLFLSLAGQENKGGPDPIKAYAKDSAVSIDGALLEGVWKNMEPMSLLPGKGISLDADKTPEPGEILFRAVYEADYIALGLALVSSRNFALPENMRHHLGDTCTIEIFSPEIPAYRAKAKISPKGLLAGESSGPFPVKGAVIAIKKWFFAEIRIPIPAKDFFYGKGQVFQLKIQREIVNEKGEKKVHSWESRLLCSEILQRSQERVAVRRSWRNGNFNTFFKRPNRKWAPNWELGKGNHLQQGWNLNKARKGIPHFEVMFHPRKNKNDTLDCYVLLRNGDFYQIYKGRERTLAYSFKAKGKGILKVYFYRFTKGTYSQYLGRIPVLTLHLDSPEWKSYSGSITKPTARERLALAFETEDAEIYLEDAVVHGTLRKSASK